MGHERDALGLGQQTHTGEDELVENALGGGCPMLAQTLGHLRERTSGVHEDIGHGAREIGRTAVVTCLLPAVVKIAQDLLAARVQPIKELLALLRGHRRGTEADVDHTVDELFEFRGHGSLLDIHRAPVARAPVETLVPIAAPEKPTAANGFATSPPSR